jgi:hypothetical protein
VVGIKWPIQEHLVFFFDMLRRMGQALEDRRRSVKDQPSPLSSLPT